MAGVGYRPVEGPLQLHAGGRVRVDTALETGGVSDPPLALASPVRAAQPSVLSTTLTATVLETTPIEPRTGPGAMTLAPAIDQADFSAFGDAGAAANGYRVEGLDGSDPERGAPWVRPAYSWIEEQHVIGPGAGAAFGGFTGVTSATLFRSGGSVFHGLADVRFRNQSLTAATVSPDLLTLNPALAPPQTDLVIESSAQIGGPLRRGRAWFFAGVEFEQARETPAGYPAIRPAGISVSNRTVPSPSASSPRLIFRPTWRRSDRDTLTAFVTAERATGQARDAGPRVAPEATLEERAHTIAWDARFTRILSPATVFEAGYAGFAGADDRQPYDGETPGWYDVAADYYAVNAPYFFDARRTRQQARARISRLMGRSGAGHDLQAGIDIAQSAARSDYGYPGGRSIDAAGGVPRFVYLWDGSRRDSSSRQVAAYAEDGWGAGARLRIEPGVRLEWTTASNRHSGARVYDAVSIAPRLGFTWQAGGASVVRGNYGWYYDDLTLARVEGLDPGIAAVYGAPVDRQLRMTGAAVIVAPAPIRRAASNLVPPRLKQAVLGIEEHVGSRLTVAAYGIDRRSDRFVEDVLPFRSGDFVKATLRDPGPDGLTGTGDETATVLDVYSQLSDPARSALEITNPAGTLRNYQGVAVTASVTAGARGYLQGSWVVSKTTGNIDGDSAAPTAEYDGPNTDPALQPLRTGRVSADRTHIARAFGSYRLPFGVLVSAALFYDSGRTFTRTLGVRVNERRLDVFAEPRGSQRYDPERRLDVRVARHFPGLRRVALSAEVFNALDAATVTARVTRSGLQYFMPTAVTAGRRIRLGATYRF